MWEKMKEGWLWGAALVDLALSFGLAQLIVQSGVRWRYMLDEPLDASNSIVAFTVMIGVLLPIIALFGGVVVAQFRSSAKGSKWPVG